MLSCAANIRVTSGDSVSWSNAMTLQRNVISFLVNSVGLKANPKSMARGFLLPSKSMFCTFISKWQTSLIMRKVPISSICSMVFMKLNSLGSRFIRLIEYPPKGMMICTILSRGSLSAILQSSRSFSTCLRLERGVHIVGSANIT